MVQYRRLPAVLVLTFAAAMAVMYLAFLAPARSAAGYAEGGGSLEDIERAIASGTADASLWLRYADALRRNGRHGHAALAFRKVLEFEPYHRDARYRCALSLAMAGQADELHAFLRELILSDAQLVVDLFEQRECRSYLSEQRFQAAHRDARSQAAD